MFYVPIPFDILSVEEGETRNWLRFTALIDYLDKNREYTFDFCGTEISHSLSLTDEVIEGLREMLVKDFGYAPYDIDKCKQILGKGKKYSIRKK